MRRIHKTSKELELKDRIINTIKNAREKAGLKQADVARILGITLPHWNKYELGEYNMALIDFLRLYKILNLDIEDFIKDIK